jgi:hypothetical protein
MMVGFRLLIDKLSTDVKKIFLIDCLGAFFTAFFLIVIPLVFSNVFGMSETLLGYLSLVACMYTAYSFCCYTFVRINWRPYLKAIAIANMAYCGLTIALVIYCRQSLTVFGLLYFLLEIIVMACLILIELGLLYKHVGRK